MTNAPKWLLEFYNFVNSHSLQYVFHWHTLDSPVSDLAGPPPWPSDSAQQTAIAMQQNQLLMSLLSCQQQLQSQQNEMRQLQNFCQDLMTSGGGGTLPPTADSSRRSSVMTQQVQVYYEELCAYCLLANSVAIGISEWSLTLNLNETIDSYRRLIHG